MSRGLRACLWLVLAIASLACSAAGPQVRPPPPPVAGDDALLPAETAAFAKGQLAPADLRCLPRQRWSTSLRADARFTAGQILDELGRHGATLPDDKREAARKQLVDTLFWRLVLTQLVEGDMHNLGAVPLGGLVGSDGKPLLLIRTSFTPAPERAGSCVQSLVGAGNVRHIVNLYAGPMPTEQLEVAERKAVEGVGGTYYTARGDPHGGWREDLREGDGGEGKKAAMIAVATLIKAQILHPGGAAPKGNVQVHCGGGMHRTGMVVGVFDRCVNKSPWVDVAAAYKRHVGWRSDSEPGGFEPQNLAFIESFECGLLEPQ